MASPGDSSADPSYICAVRSKTKENAGAGDPTLISNLPEPVRGLAERGIVRKYRARTVLIQEGEEGETVFLVLAGSIRIYCADGEGREITLAIYGVGEYVGEMSLDGGLRSASVVTEEDTVCAVISGQVFREYLAVAPDFSIELIRRLIRRTRMATENARNLALLDAYGRLSRFFEEAAVADENGDRVLEGQWTQQEISRRIGCSRELVSRFLKDLSRGGYVAIDGRRYVLKRKLPARW